MKTPLKLLVMLTLAASLFAGGFAAGWHWRAQTIVVAEDYELHIKNLTAGTPEKDIKASLRALETAGMKAFPALIAHLPDTALAEAKFFQSDRVVMVEGRIVGTYVPRIGEVCFDILQIQIEGNWPKGDRAHYVLSLRNAKQWLDEHKGLTLPQLQRASREESLRRAEAELAKDPSAQYLKSVIAFLRKDIEALKK